ncbi:DMT family transporter [Bosea sp. (in: a-proteobacteria)]|uniref:DMT family transporter n=1 Tax=Bosea sp. (in: a-proteobacteria) TaxID=1871050 RepID=UPI002604E264|nr:DMT family transporter [Bosea sp. (in: a-proteobacteria)]MCO5091884.1 DMT family transporter [Bosea sp. (in: a-proteobacteria)]
MSQTASLPRPNPSVGSYAAMLLLALMWGLSIPVTKLGLITLPPLTLTALRYAVAVPLMFVFVVGRPRLPWRAVPRLAALGILGIGIGQVAQTFGVVATAASVGTIVSATIPIFVVVFAALRLRQRVSGLQALGLLAAFAGIALVASGRGEATSVTSQTTLAGVILMLLSSVAVAFYYVWSVELCERHGTVAVVAWSTLFGFVALVPWAGWEMWHVPFTVTAVGLGAGIYLGVVVTVAGLFLWLTILRTVPARIAAGIQYLQPVVGVAAAAAMFGDALGPLFILGVALVLGGLALTVANRRGA